MVTFLISFYFPERSKWKRRALKTFCGVSSKPVRRLTREEQRDLMIKQTNIYEDPWWKRFMNVQALICAGAALSLHAFWA